MRNRNPTILSAAIFVYIYICCEENVLLSLLAMNNVKQQKPQEDVRGGGGRQTLEEENVEVNIIFGCYSQIMEMQRAAMIGAVCCQNEDAEDFILAGIEVFPVVRMPRMLLHCVKKS